MTGPGPRIEGRYGMHVHVNIATVPSFGPIGEHADRYAEHLDAAMPEVLAHHVDRWAHVDTYDDFVPFLTLHRFVAADVVELAVRAGMGEVVQVGEHLDGYCWWDAPGTDRTSVSSGPMRDLVGEMRGACRDQGVDFAVTLSRDDDTLHHDLVDRVGVDVVDTSSWRAEMPDGIEPGEWVLHRSLGASPGHNRAERAEHLLSTGALLDVLTETIAKGGSLVVDIGLGVDGTVSDLQQRPLRAVGDWVGRHADLVRTGRPFDVWGDAQIRYIAVGDELVAIDLAAGPVVVLAALVPHRYEVHSLVDDSGAPLHWEQHSGGVTISRIDGSPDGLAGVYRIGVRPVAEAVRLFDDAEPDPLPLDAALVGTCPGDILLLHEGRYAGPATIPRGVTVRGLGWDRTSVLTDATRPVVLGEGATIEHVRLTGDLDIDAQHTTMAGTRVDGQIRVTADDSIVRSVIARSIDIVGERATVERCTLHGRGDGAAISVSGGSGHRLVGNEIVGHDTAALLVGASASAISQNRIQCRRTGIHLRGCDHVDVSDNQIQDTMRAIDIEGGNGSTVRANWVTDGDSGALVRAGATDTALHDNHIERCRLGVLVWDAPVTSIGANTYVDLHEEDPCVVGPDP